MFKKTASPSGYFLTKSLRFRSSASAYLNRTPGASGNRQIFTFSFWAKLGATALSGGDIVSSNNAAGGGDAIEFQSTTNIALAGSGTNFLITTQVFRDPSAWYHIVYAVDTTQATAANRLKLYINGVQVTAFSTTNYPAQNYSFSYFNTSGQAQYIARGYSYYDGYVSEFNFIDGQQLTPSSFGSTNATTGVWQPARYTGTYGTNGFYLPFTNTTSTTTLGYDFSGNSNNWTTNNLSLTAGSTYDSMTDVPTLTSATVANYAVLNPLQTNNSGALTYANGNLNAAHGSGTSSTGGVYKALSTMASSSGKFYAEFVLNSFYSNGASGADMAVGVTSDLAAGNLLASPVGYSYYADGGGKYNNGSGSAYGSSWTTGDVIGIALDVTNGKVWFAKNNTWQASGDPVAGTNPAFSGLSGAFAFAFANSTASSAFVQNFTVNFGQQPFTYTPPTGFVALNTYNLPTSTIVKGNTVMDATTYTGTGSTLAVTNTASFKPDFVWVKERSQAQDHALFDSVRGATKQLSSNTTGAEATYANSLSAFNSNGFSVVSDAVVNSSGQTYVGWQWQAGQGTTSSNTNGSITSTVSVNATAGFSVVTYTGTGSVATIGHGLGVKPSFIIFKVRSNGTYGWYCYNSNLGATNHLVLNTTAASSSSSFLFNNTEPTSSVMTVGTSAGTNQSGETYVAYCWAEVAGFSKFGSYTGNGSTDGPFVYTGFRPKYVLFKNASAGSTDWIILDSVRDTYNVEGNMLFAELSIAEVSSPPRVDFLSNGFKLRTSSQPNDSSNTIIYAAFAENPFKNALAR